MKISYRTHEILSFIDIVYKSGLTLRISNHIEKLDLLNSFKLIPKNIFSNNFINNAFLHKEKLLKNEILGDLQDGKFIFIVHKDLAYFIDIKNDLNSKSLNVSLLVFEPGPTIDLYKEEIKYKKSDFDNSDLDPDLYFLNKSTGSIYSCLLILLFRQFAAIETLQLPAGQKVKGIDCKYINETKSDLLFFDSKWFTTLVKSDAFKVRGHFRLQPKKKDGEWTKQLIWISDFQKEGYTAPARKLTNLSI